MGSGASRHRLLPCLRPSAGGGGATTASDDYYHNNPIFERGPLDEALGHSFCYVRSSTPAHSRSSSVASFAGGGGGEGGVAETAFRTISGASVSANSSTPLPLYDSASRSHPAGFRSSSSFSAIPLQLSAPGGSGAASGPLDRGFFLSGPIERGALSGPLEPVPFSGPLVKKKRRGLAGRLRKPSLLRRSISEKNRPWVVPLRSFNGRRGDVEDDAHAAAAAEGNVQWAHGRAGEDRVHVVVSEEHRWLFIGIFDGFNGPEAPEFLVGSLYRAVFNELRDLFWEEVDEGVVEDAALDKGSDKRATFEEEGDGKVAKRLWEFLAEADCDRELDFSGSGRFAFSLSKPRYGIGSWRKDGRGVWFPKWRYDSEAKAKEAAELSSRRRRKKGPVADHGLVLNALSRALESTEAAYLDITDKVMDCNPELALMGSCLLVMLMRDEDVYVMNVGDSRAIVAQYRSQMDVDGSMSIECNLDLERRSMDEGGRGIGRNGSGGEIEGISRGAVELVALQLSTDHSTSIAEVNSFHLF